MTEESRITDAREAAAIWEQALGPLLSGEKASTALRTSAHDLRDLEERGELIVLTDAAGARCYPAFQFEQGAPLAGLVAAFRTMAAEASDWTAASWCVSEHPELDGQTPRAYAAAGKDQRQLLLVATRDSARLAQ